MALTYDQNKIRGKVRTIHQATEWISGASIQFLSYTELQLLKRDLEILDQKTKQAIQAHEQPIESCNAESKV